MCSKSIFEGPPQCAHFCFSPTLTHQLIKCLVTYYEGPDCCEVNLLVTLPTVMTCKLEVAYIQTRHATLQRGHGIRVKHMWSLHLRSIKRDNRVTLSPHHQINVPCLQGLSPSLVHSNRLSPHFAQAAQGDFNLCDFTSHSLVFVYDM